MRAGARRAGVILALGAWAVWFPALPLRADHLNPTGRTVELLVPVREEGSGALLGEVRLRITPADELSVEAARLLDALGALLSAGAERRLEEAVGADGRLDPADIEAAGLRFVYDPGLVEIRIGVPAGARDVQRLSARPGAPPAEAPPTDSPAVFAARVNIDARADYRHRGPGRDGWVAPRVALDGAMRVLGTVLESDVFVDLETGDVDRRFTRMVVDDRARLVRLMAGDILPSTAGFQSAEPLFGVAVERRYRLLDPGRVTRPTGRRSFVLERPADVDLYVDGRLVRRFRLQPGPYELRDFPLAPGANRVRLEIRDDAGRLEVLTFELFFASELLAPGLEEFFFAAGVEAPVEGGEPDYSDDPIVTGLYRRGVSENLTVGVNLQLNRRAWQVGIGAVAATRIGNLALELALSDHDNAGIGVAAAVEWDLVPLPLLGQWRFAATAWSADFTDIGDLRADNPFVLELRAGTSFTLPFDVLGTLNLQYGFGRGRTDDRRQVSVNLSRSWERFSLGLDASWEDGTGDPGFDVLLTASWDFAPEMRIEATASSEDPRIRASWRREGGPGVGSLSWNLEASADRDGLELSGDAFYRGARGDVSLAHELRLAGLGGGVRDQRTSLRLATALVWADGEMAVARPVGDAFAILVPHPTLEGRRIFVNPGPEGDQGASGLLGAAVASDLGAYSRARITYEVEDLPPGYDLGPGVFELDPPYGGGYRLVVGSAYNVTALGTLLDLDGRPVALASGEAVELARPERPPVLVFTNRVGRFGALGLAAGRWRLVLNTLPRLVYEIEIPEGATGLVRLGELRPKGVEDGR